MAQSRTMPHHVTPVIASFNEASALMIEGIITSHVSNKNAPLTARMAPQGS